MVSTAGGFSILALACYMAGASAETVQFFYNHQLETCNWGSTTFWANNNTLNGGLCAFVASINRVYACPAPDPTCWTKSQRCTGNGLEPNPNQRKCEQLGTTWCCSNQEICTVAKDQINVCVGQFRSFNEGLNLSVAMSAQYSAVPSSAIGTSTVTSLPSIVALSTFFPDTGTSSTNANATASTLTSRPNLSSGTNPANSTSGDTSKDPTLSGAAIAGIIVGALGGLAMILATVIFLFRDKRRGVRIPEMPTPPSMSTLEQMVLEQKSAEQTPPQTVYQPYGMIVSPVEGDTEPSIRFRELNGVSTRSYRRAEMPEHNIRHEIQ